MVAKLDTQALGDELGKLLEMYHMTKIDDPMCHKIAGALAVLAWLRDQNGVSLLTPKLNAAPSVVFATMVTNGLEKR